jgi:hypothetical protein
MTYFKEPDIWTRITDREAELSQLYERIDDSKAILLDPYVMMDLIKDPTGKTPMTGVLNTKVNNAEILVNAIRDDLIGTAFQCVVEGDESELPKTSRSYIERFASAVTEQIDEQLLRAGYVSLLEWLAFHVPAEGLIGGCFISRLVNGKYVVKYNHYDMRNVAWEFGEDGLWWHSNREPWTKGAINQYFGKLDQSRATTDCEVVDYYDDKWNRVYIGGKELVVDKKVDGVWYKYPQEHKFGCDPAVIACTSSGYLYKDTKYLANSMQDALYLNKGLYEAMNRNATIVQTKALEVAKPRIIKPKKNIDSGPPPELPGMGQQAMSEIDEIPETLKTPDFTQSLQTAMQEMNQKAQEGGYTSVDLGTDLGNVNAIWITRVNELREKHLRTGKSCITNFYSQLWRKIIEQARGLKDTGGSEIKIGSTGKKLQYKSALLSDPDTYSIKAKTMTRNRALEVANMSEYVATEGRISKKYRLENLLYVDDVEGEIRQQEIEKLREMYPEQALIYTAEQLAYEIDGKTGLEADLVEMKFNETLSKYKELKQQQRMTQMQGVSGQPQPQPKGNTNALAATAARGG